MGSPPNDTSGETTAPAEVLMRVLQETLRLSNAPGACESSVLLFLWHNFGTTYYTADN